MKIIDLSMTIKDHWRWNMEHTLKHDFERGDHFRTSIYKLGAHAFTHVDTPLHCNPGSVTLEKLDVYAYSGSTAVVDISFIKPNQAITVQTLEENGAHIQSGDIILLKTCWDLHFSPDSKEYWTEAPYVTEDAAIWLKEKNPRVVGFDFPQEYPLRFIERGNWTLEEQPTHKHLLFNGILHIEYLCNMSEVKNNRIELIALPLKIEGFEGGPARVIAIEK